MALNPETALFFLGDQVHSFEKGQQIKSEFKINQALLLGFDVYNQEPSVTRKKLETLGIDLSKSCEVKDSEDRVQLIFGTTAIEDTKSPQFWIDKEGLYLTRVITNPGKHTDICFKKYQTINNFPVATQILFYIDNELSIIEEYFNIKFPTTIDDVIFSLDQFKQTRW